MNSLTFIEVGRLKSPGSEASAEASDPGPARAKTHIAHRIYWLHEAFPIPPSNALACLEMDVLAPIASLTAHSNFVSSLRFQRNALARNHIQRVHLNECPSNP